ncbi:MAG TPA: hypothetical protein VFV31_10400 [Chitinophagaceae bacterium]|nr:hypothetical protein [Chitinophagaceae bacterium]
MKNSEQKESIIIPDELKKVIDNQVQESLYFVENNSETRKNHFTAVEMWHYQKNSRSASAMLRKWNLN